jgi:hypothetical protein
MKGAQQHEQVLLLGSTPGYLKQHGAFPDLNLAITGKTVSKAVFDHGIPTSTVKRLPDIIANNAKCLFQSATQPDGDSVIVLTLEVHLDCPIIIPIRKNQKTGRSQYHNLIVSMYGKEGHDPEKRWKQQGLLLWDSGRR